MEECVFCDIANGKESAGIIYQDSTCLVILDKFPITRGHMLVISKEHYNDILAAPDDVAMHMFLITKKFSKRAIERLGAAGINIGSNIGAPAGQLIWHAHIHIIPRYPNMKRNFDFGRHGEIAKEDIAELVKLLKD